MLFLFLLLPPDMDKGVDLSRKGDHQASEAVLKQITSTDPKYTFYRLVNAFKLNDKPTVDKVADEIIHSFGNYYPPRYVDLATIMKADAATWKKKPDDLGDISREMTKITDRLKNNKGGPETQQLQKEVLARIDKMIKDHQDKEKQKQKEEEERKEAQVEQGQDKDGKTQGQPAQDTIPGQANGPGHVNKKKVKEIAEVWGKLPEKERAQAMRELVRTIPAKDRAIIENYLREIQKRNK